MAIIYYDFSSPTNGTGASELDPRNTWVAPGNDDVIRLKPGVVWRRTTQVSFGTATNITIEPWPSYYLDAKPQKPIITHTATSTFAWNFQGDGVHRIKDIQFLNCSSNTNGGIIGSGLVAATGVFAQLDIRNCEFENTAFNAIRLSGVGTQSAPTFKCLNTIFNNIGEDAIYGGALNYEVGYCKMTNLSKNTATGDGIGFLGSTPTIAWIHDNYIDHRGNANKHCIIIDKTGGTAGVGNVLIERNTLLADGTVNVNFIGCNGIVRFNKITAGDIAFSNDTDGSKYYCNYIYITSYRDNATGTISLPTNNNEVVNNTIIAPSNVVGVIIVSGTSTTGTIIKNNLVVNGTTFYKRGNGATETFNNNAFQNMINPYIDSSNAVITPAVSDIFNNTLVSEAGVPNLNSQVLTNGEDLGWQRDINGILNKKFIGVYSNTTKATPRGIR